MSARIRYLRHRSLSGLERGRLRYTERALRRGVTGAERYEFTADNLTNTITVVNQDTLAGQTPRVVLHGDDLPTGLESGQIYWLADAGANAYTLHLSEADAASGANPAAFTDDGTAPLELSVLE